MLNAIEIQLIIFIMQPQICFPIEQLRSFDLLIVLFYDWNHWHEFFLQIVQKILRGVRIK